MLNPKLSLCDKMKKQMIVLMYFPYKTTETCSRHNPKLHNCIHFLYYLSIYLFGNVEYDQNLGKLKLF